MSTYVLNTIAFKKDLDNGVSQSRLVEKVKQLGFDAIEIRNEFLNGSKNERLAIAKETQKLGLEVFYSVNDVLVTGDHLNNKALDYVTDMKISMLIFQPSKTLMVKLLKPFHIHAAKRRLVWLKRFLVLSESFGELTLHGLRLSTLITN